MPSYAPGIVDPVAIARQFAGAPSPDQSMKARAIQGGPAPAPAQPAAPQFSAANPKAAFQQAYASGLRGDELVNSLNQVPGWQDKGKYYADRNQYGFETFYAAPGAGEGGWDLVDRTGSIYGQSPLSGFNALFGGLRTQNPTAGVAAGPSVGVDASAAGDEVARSRNQADAQLQDILSKLSKRPRA